jgi:DNA-binding phage protein
MNDLRGEFQKSVPYTDGLMERLKDPEYAAAYLSACLKDNSEDAEEAFRLALLDVAKAHGISNPRTSAERAVDRAWENS